MNVRVREDGTLYVEQSNGNGYRATGAPDSLPIYGQGGLFGVCGMDPQVVAAVVNPTGVERILRWIGTDITHPIYDALVDIQSTGFDQASGCAPCGKPSFKEAPLTARFGRYCQQTEEQQIDRIGLRMNPGVPEIAMYGSITGPDGGVIIPQGQPITDGFMLSLMGVAYNLRRHVGQQIWEGDGTNVGGYEQMIGLQLLVNTGQREAFNHTLVPAFDSQLIDFGSAIVGATGSPSIRHYIRSVVLSIRYRIASMNLDPDASDMYIVMRPQTWEAVSGAIACEYGYSCDVGPTAEQDAREVQRYREMLLANSHIPIDGRNYPVVLDNQIPVTRGYYGDETSHCSDIYVLTTRIEGKTVLWGEYQDFNMTAGDAIQYMARTFGASNFSVTDGGKFLHAPTTYGGFCFDVKTLVKPRLVCIMPQVQGRVQNVCVTTLANYPDVTGSGGLYSFDDGLTTKPYLGLYDQGYDNRNPVQ